MSKTGLLMCALYAAVIAACVGYVFFCSTDPKGSFVFLQLPIVLQSALVVSIGLTPLLEDISWPVAYVLLAGPVFVLLYGLGMLIDRKRPNLLVEETNDGDA
jgi:hypothetical protein